MSPRKIKKTAQPRRPKITFITKNLKDLHISGRKTSEKKCNFIPLQGYFLAYFF